MPSDKLSRYLTVFGLMALAGVAACCAAAPAMAGEQAIRIGVLSA